MKLYVEGIRFKGRMQGSLHMFGACVYMYVCCGTL